MRDLVQHIGCYIQYAFLLFSIIVSRIRVYLFCWAGNRQYYIVVGFAKHDHITAWSTSYMCTNITVNWSKNVIQRYTSQNPKNLFCFLKFRLVGWQEILRDMIILGGACWSVNYSKTQFVILSDARSYPTFPYEPTFTRVSA